MLASCQAGEEEAHADEEDEGLSAARQWFGVLFVVLFGVLAEPSLPADPRAYLLHEHARSTRRSRGQHAEPRHIGQICCEIWRIALAVASLLWWGTLQAACDCCWAPHAAVRERGQPLPSKEVCAMLPIPLVLGLSLALALLCAAIPWLASHQVGYLGIDNHNQLAHRIALELKHGPSHPGVAPSALLAQRLPDQLQVRGARRLPTESRPGALEARRAVDARGRLACALRALSDALNEKTADALLDELW